MKNNNEINNYNNNDDERLLYNLIIFDIIMPMMIGATAAIIHIKFGSL